jgi:hypothetical protein
MKKYIIIALFFISASAFSQNEWTELTYHYQTGTVAPQYYYTYDAILTNSGTLTLVFHPGYYDTTWTYTMEVNADSLKALKETIISSGILTEKIEKTPDMIGPLGGSMQNIRIVMAQDPNLDQMPPIITIPYFPATKKNELNNIYEKIKNLIPESTMNEIKERKERFQRIILKEEHLY